MYELLLKIFDAIFPHSAESNSVRALTREQMHSLFLIQHVHEVTVLSSYADSRVRALIHEAKFHGNPKAFALLNVLYTQYLEHFAPPIDIVIPIPLSPARLRSRGFNQVTKMLENHSYNPIDTTVLVRTLDTAPQTELPRIRRLENVRDAFKVAHPERIVGKHILLIDDVMTTGATLRAAKASLFPPTFLRPLRHLLSRINL